MNYILGGEKYYELKDHLGNVRLVMTDVRDQDKIAPAAITDYYPYGMMMPGRHWEKPEYMYGFNGMERADYVQENSRANEIVNPKKDLSGTCNSYDFGKTWFKNVEIQEPERVDVNIFPNPVVSDELNIIWDNPIECDLSVFDITGRYIIANHRIQPGKQILPLIAGYYFVKLLFEDGSTKFQMITKY